MNFDDIVDRCNGEKFDGCLSDFDPLVVVMEVVADIIGQKRLRENPKARQMWIRVMEHFQKDGDLEHNTYIPCRYCDTSFEPVVDDELLDLFLNWLESNQTEQLLAIHRCATCGGKLKSLRSKKYVGDEFSPHFQMIDDDDEWRDSLLSDQEDSDDES